LSANNTHIHKHPYTLINKSADIDVNNEFLKADEWIHLEDEPTHQDLCNREQLFFQKAIVEDLDLKKQSEDALNSLRIAFACDQAVKTKSIITL